MMIAITSTSDPTYDVIETVTTPIDTHYIFNSDNYTQLVLSDTNKDIWATVPGTLDYSYSANLEIRPFE